MITTKQQTHRETHDMAKKKPVSSLTAAEKKAKADSAKAVRDKKKAEAAALKKQADKKADASAPSRQLVMNGDGFPAEPPEEVCTAMDAFLGARRASVKANETKVEREVRLIELMREHGINRIRLDGENKFFEIEATPHVKVKTMPKEQRSSKNGKDGVEVARS